MADYVEHSSHMRDAQAAETAGQLMEQGYFGTSCTMYGCVYCENGAHQYKTSTKAEDVYSFIETCNLTDVFPSNVYSVTKIYDAPMDMAEMCEQEAKDELEKRLREMFPIAFFERLQDLASWVKSDTAADTLVAQMKRLEACFDLETLQLFEDQVNYFYTCRKLHTDTLAFIRSWLDNKRKGMPTAAEEKDLFERTLYGFMYAEEGRMQYVEDACMSYIYHRLYRLEAAGYATTQVYRKTFWYNHTYRLADVRKDFKMLLRNAVDQAYLEKVETLRHDPSKAMMFEHAVREIQEAFGADAAETVMRYGGRWGLYRKRKQERTDASL